MNQLPRFAFFAGLFFSITIGAYLVWLWQPERQVLRHTDNLMLAVEKRDWKRVQEFISSDYQDQWHNDRPTLLERTRAVFTYLRTIKFTCERPTVSFDDQSGHWQSRITVSGEASEGLLMIQDRVNSISSPFDLEWRHTSWKPWDWKLVRLTNAQLAIPELGY